MTASAEPYIAYVSRFTQIIQPYVSSGASTTSSTTVTAASSPTPVALTLASATGFTTGDRIVVDVDDRQELVNAESLSGSTLTVLLTKAHTGTYPVTVEAGESIIRECLTRIREVKAKMATAFGAGMLKQVDEIQFYNSASALTYFGELGNRLMFWRDELATSVGTANLWRVKRGGGSQLAVY